MIDFEKATQDDAAALTAVSTRTFDDDSQRFLNTPSGGPPGYDDLDWHRRIITQATVYTLRCDNAIVGGLIIFPNPNGEYWLGRIFIDPAYQDRGLGTQAMHFIEQAFPGAHTWKLDTPAWAVRNHHFYEKLGYRLISQNEEDYVYQKTIGVQTNGTPSSSHD